MYTVITSKLGVHVNTMTCANLERARAAIRKALKTNADSAAIWQNGTAIEFAGTGR